MAEFQELVKNFQRIRDYMRQFYVYGFKVRGDYTEKSARTYDNERRRIESWLSPFSRKSLPSVLSEAPSKTNITGRIRSSPLNIISSYILWKTGSSIPF